jgi:tetratricopeptide (TPR) repeat protein
MSHLHAAQREAAERYLARMEEIAKPVLERDPEVSAWVKTMRAFHARYVERDPFAALALDKAALAHFAVAGDRRYGPYVEMHVGLDWALLGAMEEAEAALERAIRAAGPASPTTQTARVYLGRALAQGGRREEAEKILGAVVEESRARGEGTGGLNARLALAEVRLSRGDLEAAGPELDALVPEVVDLPIARMSLRALRASLRLARGRAEEALAMAEEGIAESERLGMYHLNHAQLPLVRALALVALGRAGEARAASRAARAELLTRAQRIGDEALRKSFLERVPSHAGILALEARI